jgi:hypothetical protein
MTTTCPSCHTAAPEIPDAPLTVGGTWQCSRCGQQWDVRRLATAAAYGEYAQRRAIPGARELNTLTQRVAGSGGFDAAALPPVAAIVSSMDAATIAAHQREGGGAPNQRRTRLTDKN